MDVTDLIETTFDTDDHESLFDPEFYSDRELREDKIRVKQERTRLERELEKYENKYKRLLDQGADASDIERRQFAQKAKLTKRRYEIIEKRYRKQGVILATLITIEGIRELFEQQDKNESNIANIVADAETDVGALRETFQDQMAQHHLDVETMQEVQRSLDIDVLPSESTLSATDEAALMDSVAADDLDTESIDIDQDIGEIDPDIGDIELDGSPTTDEPDVLPIIEDTDGSLTTDVNHTDDDRLEIDIYAADERTIRIRDYDARVSTTWTTETDLIRFVETVTDTLELTDTARMEAGWETTDDEIERETGTVRALESADWFPNACRFLVIEGPDYEVRWGDDPGQEGTYEVSITTGSDTRGSAVSDLLRETLRKELSDELLSRLMGRTGFIIEDYSLGEQEPDTTESTATSVVDEALSALSEGAPGRLSGLPPGTVTAVKSMGTALSTDSTSDAVEQMASGLSAEKEEIVTIAVKNVAVTVQRSNPDWPQRKAEQFAMRVLIAARSVYSRDDFKRAMRDAVSTNPLRHRRLIENVASEVR
ncbi:NFACT family protein [Natrinema longum]|uniref:NFACT family protein n=1 Tax=Natrinema longum TaxID=370324 RepID=UPI001CCCA538|nr:NFACT family protein [Natrinema longum]MBZ6497177.1 NFACT family protein [Natrinema longum]